MQEIKKIIAVGASITDSFWWTWKDFVAMDSGLQLINLATKGSGNEFMMHNLLRHNNLLDEHTLVVVMLTNIDKFDWFIGTNTFNKLLSEKHAPIDFGNQNGFWCTGSWFPGLKKNYQDTFYNEDYFVVKTIQQIILLEQLEEIYKCKIILTFDSPIWTYTDQDLNNFTKNLSVDKEHNQLLSHTLSKYWTDVLSKKYIDITNKSLIGYCMANNLEWYNQYYKAHPPASSHYNWYKNVLAIELKKYINLDLKQDYNKKIEQMDKIWHKKY